MKTLLYLNTRNVRGSCSIDFPHSDLSPVCFYGNISIDVMEHSEKKYVPERPGTRP